MKNILNKIDNVFGWVVWSSKDPEKVAATAKGMILYFVTAVISASSFFGYDFGSLQGIVEPVGSIIANGLYMVSGIMMVYGIIRKIYLSFMGRNMSLR